MKRILVYLLFLFIFGVFFYIVNFNYGFKFGFGGEDWLKYCYIDNYYIEYGVEEVGGMNIVIDIVFDYCGYDIFGEVIVFFIVIVGVVVFLRFWRRDEE